MFQRNKKKTWSKQDGQFIKRRTYTVGPKQPRRTKVISDIKYPILSLIVAYSRQFL